MKFIGKGWSSKSFTTCIVGFSSQVIHLKCCSYYKQNYNYQHPTNIVWYLYMFGSPIAWPLYTFQTCKVPSLHKSGHHSMRCTWMLPGICLPLYNNNKNEHARLCPSLHQATTKIENCLIPPLCLAVTQNEYLLSSTFCQVITEWILLDPPPYMFGNNKWIVLNSTPLVCQK